MVHDERNEAGVGDVVEVTECSPYRKPRDGVLLAF